MFILVKICNLDELILFENSNRIQKQHTIQADNGRKKLRWVRPFLLKTSILMNLFYFKIPAGYKNVKNCLIKLFIVG